MADSTPRQRSLVRIVGVDMPKVASPLPIASLATQKEKIAIPDTANERLMQAQGVVDATFSIEAQAIEASSQEARAKSAAKGSSIWGQELSALADTVAKGYSFWNERKATEAQLQADIDKRYLEAKEEAAKLELEQQKELLKEQSSKAQSEVEVVLQDALYQVQEHMAQGAGQLGVTMARQTFETAIAQYRSVLGEEAFQEFYRYGMTQINEAQKQSATRTYEAARDTRAAVIDNTKAKVQLELSAAVSSLEFARTPEEVEFALSQVWGITNDNISATGLNEQEALELQTSVLTAVLPNLSKAQGSAVAVQQRLEAIAKYSAGIEALNALLNDPDPEKRIGWNKYVELKSALATELRLDADTASAFLDPTGLLKNGADLLEVNERLRKLALSHAQEEQERQLALLDSQATGALVFDVVVANPHKLTQKGTIPESIRGFATSFLEDSDRINKLKREVAAGRTELEKLITGIDPTSRLGLRQQFNQVTETYDSLPRDPTVSAEQAQARRDELALAVNEMEQIYQKWAQYGLDPGNPRRSVASSYNLQSLKTQQDAIGATLPQGGGTGGSTERPNFNPAGAGGAPAAVPARPLAKATHDGSTFAAPFPEGTNAPISSEQGMRGHPVQGGQRYHAGIDFAVPSGTIISSVRGGKVVAVSMSNESAGGGYGYYIAVENAEGNLEMFAHMSRGASFVKVGDVIPPGAPVGRSGNSGTGTGAHLHFNVYKSAEWALNNNMASPQSQMVDAEAYLKQTRFAQYAPRGQGAPPRQYGGGPVAPISFPPAFIQLLKDAGVDTTQFVVDVQARVGTRASTSGQVPAPGVTRRASVQGNNASIRLEDYAEKNNPTANYGYDTLAKQPGFARELAKLGDRMGVPAQWLADVMYSECGLNPRNSMNRQAAGLIQFYDGQGLKRVASLMGVSEAEAKRRFWNGQVPIAQHMEYVYDYFKNMGVIGKLRTLEDLYLVVFNGTTNLDLPPHRRQDIGDRNIKFDRLIDRLGSSAGRRYRHSYVNRMGRYDNKP